MYQMRNGGQKGHAQDATGDGVYAGGRTPEQAVYLGHEYYDRPMSAWFDDLDRALRLDPTGPLPFPVTLAFIAVLDAYTAAEFKFPWRAYYVVFQSRSFQDRPDYFRGVEAARSRDFPFLAQHFGRWVLAYPSESAHPAAGLSRAEIREEVLADAEDQLNRHRAPNALNSVRRDPDADDTTDAEYRAQALEIDTGGARSPLPPTKTQVPAPPGVPGGLGPPATWHFDVFPNVVAAAAGWCTLLECAYGGWAVDGAYLASFLGKIRNYAER
jgi:hypothetical protein